MKLNRRQFGQQLLAGSLLLGSSPYSFAGNKPAAIIASAGKAANGQHYLNVISLAGETHYRINLPERAHDVVFHPHQPWIAVTARRPGYYLWVVNYQTGEKLFQLAPEDGSHFYGHAEFSADGQQLFTTENEILSGKGKVVIRDLTRRGAITAQHSSFGIGPHQLKLMPDQRTLVIANGGILTNPEQQREKLNLDTMQPSLVYVDSITGTLREQVRLPEHQHQLSIRHLDVNAKGRVIFGMQYQGDLMDDMPLVATHQRGHSIHILHAPKTTQFSMKQYVGSVCFDRSGQYAMASCPRGNTVTLWDIERQEFIEQVTCADGCGLGSVESGAFLISNGRGTMYRYDMLSKRKEKLRLGFTMAWDNHMAAL